MRQTRLFPVVLLLLLATAGQALAQAPAQAEEAHRFGIGFQSSWPAYGISGLYDVNDRITAQVVVGAFGALTTLSARGIYHFQKEQKHSLYGYGTVGLWRHDWITETENSPGIGGGAGIELNWRNIVDDSPESTFPRLYSSFDLGFVAASFNHYNFSGFVFGGGIHYRF